MEIESRKAFKNQLESKVKIGLHADLVLYQKVRGCVFDTYYEHFMSSILLISERFDFFFDCFLL